MPQRAPHAAQRSTARSQAAAQQNTARSQAAVPQPAAVPLAAGRSTAPAPGPLGALASADHRGAFAITNRCTSTDMAWLEANSSPDNLGLTTPPQGSRAPAFDLGTTPDPNGGWYCHPTLTRAHDKGDNESRYLRAGNHVVGSDPTSGRIAFVHMSRAMAAVAKAAEMEHVTDIQQAAQISLVEAENVLNNHIVARDFPTAPTPQAAEKHVLDDIDARVDPKLGSDQNTWNGTYLDLCELSRTRDTNGWHSLDITAPYPAGNRDRCDVTQTATFQQPGTVPSAQLITYQNLP